MAIQFKSFACQDSLITPVALAVNEAATNISDQVWSVVFSGIGILDLQGNNSDDWRHETLLIWPDVRFALDAAIVWHRIPVPPAPAGMSVIPGIQVDQFASYAAVSSSFAKNTDDIGFAIDAWRLAPFFRGADALGIVRDFIFTGTEVDLAVRNDKATMYRVSYHITIIGQIFFFVTDVINPNPDIA